MYIDKSYSKIAPYPKDDIAPEEKGIKWHYDMAIAIYSAFLNNRCAQHFTDLGKLIENRQYGAGMQDHRQYIKTMVALADDKSKPESEIGLSEGWYNVNFEDIISVIPKFKNILKGIFTATPTSIGCYGYDESAGKLREELEYQLQMKMVFRDTIEMVKAFIQDQQDEDYIPASLRELEMFKNLGGLKLREETAMEILLKKTEDVSKWDEIFENLIDDSFDIGMLAARSYTDIHTGIIKYRYIDPLESGFIIDGDGNVIRGFTVRYVPIFDIRANDVYSAIGDNNNNPKLIAGEELERKLSQLATKFSSDLGNAAGFSYTNIDPGRFPYGYDQVLIPVLEWESLTTDTTYHTTRKGPSGDPITHREHWRKSVDYNGKARYSKPKLYSSDDKVTTASNIRTVRKGSWIIGTDLVFETGLLVNTPRPKPSEAYTSFVFKKIKGQPMARLCKRPADDIQLANLRIQNALAMAPNAGVAYEWSSLKSVNIKKGDRNLEPYDLMRMKTQTGSTIVNTKNGRGQTITSGNPLMELQGGIGQLLGECITIIQKSVGDIQSQLGFNEFTDGSTPAERSGVGIGQMATAATSNALRPMHTKLADLRVELARNASRQIQVVCKHSEGGVEAYAEIIGEPLIKAIEIGSSFTSITSTVRIIEEASPQEIQAMENDLQVAMASGKNGVPLIKMSDYFAIKRILKSKASLKFAQLLMAERERQMEKASIEASSRNAKENADNAIAVQREKDAAEMEKEKQKSALLREEETHRVNEEIRKYRELKSLGIKNVPGIADVTSNLAEEPIRTDAMEPAVQ
jgi:hypothetical protein